MKDIITIQWLSSYFTAGTVWEFNGNQWVCTKAAPIIKWMVGKDLKYCFDHAHSKGWDHYIV